MPFRRNRGAGVATRLPTGSKVSLLLALVLLVVAIYLLIVPIAMPTSQGVFGCGSALQPPTDQFAAGICQDVPQVNQLRSATMAVLALIVGAGGLVLFGAGRGAERPAADPTHVS